MKRLLTLILTISLVLAIMPTNVHAAGDFEIANGVLIKYNGPGGDVIIPDGVTHIGDDVFRSITSVTIPNSVKSIGARAFYRTALSEITIPDSVTEIGFAAFAECSRLTRVTLSKNLTKIEDSLFSDCSSLENITIPNGVRSIGQSSFRRCSSLKIITISDGLTSIAGGAFAACTSLVDIIIPSSVTDIAGSAFGGCTSLTSILIEPSNEYFVSVDGILYNRSMTELLVYLSGKKIALFQFPIALQALQTTCLVEMNFSKT